MVDRHHGHLVDQDLLHLIVDGEPLGIGGGVEGLPEEAVKCFVAPARVVVAAPCFPEI